MSDDKETLHLKPNAGLGDVRSDAQMADDTLAEVNKNLARIADSLEFFVKAYREQA